MQHLTTHDLGVAYAHLHLVIPWAFTWSKDSAKPTAAWSVWGKQGVCVCVKMTVSRCMMVYVHTYLHTCKIQKGLTKELWKVQDDISKSTKNTHHHAQHWIPHPKNQNKLCIPHLSIQSSIVRSGVLDLLQILATWLLRTWCSTYKHDDAWVCISIIAPLPKSKINKHINKYIYILLCICISISERWLRSCA